MVTVHCYIYERTIFSKFCVKSFQIPQSYLFTTPSDTMLHDANLNFSSLLVDANKMFPSQRRALYQKSVKSSVGQFVAAVTQNDVEESMLELMPPSLFKDNIADIRDNLGKLTAQELVNVAYFPNALVSLVGVRSLPSVRTSSPCSVL